MKWKYGLKDYPKEIPPSPEGLEESETSDSDDLGEVDNLKTILLLRSDQPYDPNQDLEAQFKDQILCPPSPNSSEPLDAKRVNRIKRRCLQWDYSPTVDCLYAKNYINKLYTEEQQKHPQYVCEDYITNYDRLLSLNIEGPDDTRTTSKSDFDTRENYYKFLREAAKRKSENDGLYISDSEEDAALSKVSNSLSQIASKSASFSSFHELDVSVELPSSQLLPPEPEYSTVVQPQRRSLGPRRRMPTKRGRGTPRGRPRENRDNTHQDFERMKNGEDTLLAAMFDEKLLLAATDVNNQTDGVQGRRPIQGEAQEDLERPRESAPAELQAAVTSQGISMSPPLPERSQSKSRDDDYRATTPDPVMPRGKESTPYPVKGAFHSPKVLQRGFFSPSKFIALNDKQLLTRLSAPSNKQFKSNGGPAAVMTDAKQLRQAKEEIQGQIAEPETRGDGPKPDEQNEQSSGQFQENNNSRINNDTDGNTNTTVASNDNPIFVNTPAELQMSSSPPMSPPLQFSKVILSGIDTTGGLPLSDILNRERQNLTWNVEEASRQQVEEGKESQ